MRDFKFFNEKRQPTAATEQSNPVKLDAFLESMPGLMPLTNRLDKMTRDQAIWAIENGDAWIAYLQKQSEAGREVSVIEYGEQPVQNDTVSDADRYKAICDVVDRVWKGLTDNMKRKTLRATQYQDWVSTLEWAIKALPEGYERQRDIFQEELQQYAGYNRI